MRQIERSDTASSTDDLVREYTQNATRDWSFSGKTHSINRQNWTHGDNSVLTNWEVHLYGDVFHAIDQMVRLPEDDPLSLEPEVAHRALNLLGFLKEQIKVDPPRIINQDGEAIAFTWVEGNLKRYLTVADDEVDLMHLLLDRPFHCEEVLSHDKQIPYQEIFERLSAETKSHSIENER